MLAFPAINLATLPLTHLGDFPTWGNENNIDPCFGGEAPFLCAAIAACAPSTCNEPDGILANLSLLPAKTSNFEALKGPIRDERVGI